MTEKATPEIRAYLRKHPDCSYEELTKALGLKSLSKPWFYALRSGVRKSMGGPGKHLNLNMESGPVPKMTVQILESIDASDLSPALRKEYVDHFQPLLQQVAPEGRSMQVVVLEHPPRIEIRRLIS